MKPADLLHEAQGLLDDAVGLRRRIHRHPNRMVLNEAAMASGIAVHAAVALAFLDGSPRGRP